MSIETLKRRELNVFIAIAATWGFLISGASFFGVSPVLGVIVIGTTIYIVHGLITLKDRVRQAIQTLSKVLIGFLTLLCTVYFIQNRFSINALLFYLLHLAFFFWAFYLLQNPVIVKLFLEIPPAIKSSELSPTKRILKISFVAAILSFLIQLAPLYQAATSKHWPSVRGEIVESGFKDNVKQRGTKIAYRYEVNGVPYTSNYIAVGIRSVGSKKHTQTILAKYPVGAMVDVYYSPSKPKISVLETGLNVVVCSMWIPFFILFFVVIYVLLFIKRFVGRVAA